MSDFIQIHMLTSHPASLLNRGEDGLAKTMPFGGETRTRISSQCLKYTWRQDDRMQSVDETEMAVRSRQTFYRKVAEPLIDEGYDAELVYPAAANLRDVLADSNESPSVEDSVEAGREDDSSHLHLDQVVVFGPPELEFMREAIREDLESIDKNPEDLGESDLTDYTTGEISESAGAVAPAGVDAAMFGRMTTDESDAGQIEASVHVKHALTVHPHQRESDYFIAADDFQDSGGGHLNAKDLTSGLYYTNVVVDYDGLIHNLSGREDIASELIGRLIGVMSTVTPGAKKSSTAPYSHAELLMVERGEKQPRTLANAFRDALPASATVEDAQAELEGYLSGMDSMYGKPEDRWVCGTQLPDETGALGDRTTLSQIQEQV
ncbi:type I-E CRISPR-associated protein Cas7/Cse4/CasC [Salinibacter ruber]|uniref:type I-E CRISPR-associated protein Cas7/Cse4/CasC n=1 Tax=Salinibacter ruber TaxID=146919 RepID=UPI00216A80ED|nr:type I-E CRISPR-associated protein Cas7/Cse4/CasC [Salinibacter ruber]MCS4054093.1 CRISPR system Cascade subunit CasC [Salinibacter ruber]